MTKKPTALGRLTNSILRTRVNGAIAKVIPKASRIVEVGPGQGDFTRWCLENGHSYVCFDNNELILENAKKLGAEGYLGFVPPIIQDDKSADCIVLSHVFEHMPNHEKAYDLLKEIHRVLKPGGVAVFLFPDFNSWGMDFWIDYTHAFIVTPYRFETMLSDSDFAVIHKKHFYAHFDFIPGWFLDQLVKRGSALLKIFFPFNYKLAKAQVMFHANLFMIAKKNK